MALLPWEDWFYQVNYKKDEVNKIHQDIVKLGNQVDNALNVYSALLGDYRKLLATNVIITDSMNQINFNDLEQKRYEIEVNLLQDMPHDSIPIAFVQTIVEAVAVARIVKTIGNVSTLVKKGVFKTFKSLTPRVTQPLEFALRRAGLLTRTAAEDTEQLALRGLGEGLGEGVGEGLGEALGEGVGGAVGEALGEGVGVGLGGSLSTIAGGVVGIMGALGFDALLGAINGRNQASELDKIIDQLKESVKKGNDSLQSIKSESEKLKNAIPDEIERFEGLVFEAAQATHIVPSFNYAYEPKAENLHLVVMELEPAIKTFGIVIKMKNDWENAVKKKPELTMDQFIEAISMTSDFNEETLIELSHIIAERSDSMKQGWERTERKIKDGLVTNSELLNKLKKGHLHQEITFREGQSADEVTIRPKA